MNYTGKNKMRKTVFTIHLDHTVRVSTLQQKPLPSDGSVKFSTESELGRLTADWPSNRLVEIWNKLPKVKKVFRFANRRTALHRIWSAIQDLTPAERGLTAGVGDSSTKTERIVALLKSPSGASLRAIMDLTGWQSHSVRGFISAQLARRMDFQIQSFKRDGERIYRIRS
jgi:hypothetical protein